MTEPPAQRAVEQAGLAHRVIKHGPVRNLTEAAEARGVEPAHVIKTLVVRRADDDFLFVLVPRLAGRQITLGAGEHGTAIAVAADDALAALNAQLADISDDETRSGSEVRPRGSHRP